MPDLVFLDLSQPSLTGLKVLRAIKAKPELMHIPIVVAVGAGDSKFIRAVYKLNGNCFIRKPDEMAQFLRFIETCYQFWDTVVTLSPNGETNNVRTAKKALDNAAKVNAANAVR